MSFATGLRASRRMVLSTSRYVTAREEASPSRRRERARARMEVSQPEDWAEVRRVVWMVGMEEVARRVVLRVVRREGGRGCGMGRGMGRRGGVVVVDIGWGGEGAVYGEGEGVGGSLAS